MEQKNFWYWGKNSIQQQTKYCKLVNLVVGKLENVAHNLFPNINNLCREIYNLNDFYYHFF